MAITIDGTNGLTSDNAALKLDGTTLVVDDTNNRVGIGTASPSNPLTVRTSGTSTSVGGNIAARIESNGSGYASTLQFSDNVANSSYISMVGSATVFGQAGTERLRILAGGGITFNGDTAAANALDDYEEGTWTPTITCSGSAPTVGYSLQVGYYTKIGRQVFINGIIALSSLSGGTGAVNISGLPFASSNSTQNASVGAFGQMTNFNTAYGNTDGQLIVPRVNIGASSMNIYESYELGGTDWDTARLSSTFEARFSASYFV